MDWLILTILSVFLVSLANILQRVLMRDNKSNPYSYAVVFHFLIAFLNLIFAIVVGFHLPSLTDKIWLYLLTAALWGGSTVFLFKALQLLESSEVTILGTIRVLVTIATSVIFLQESFNGQKILGTIVILISTVLVANLKKGIKFNKGILYILGFAVFSGLAIVGDAYNIRSADAATYNVIMNLLIGLLLLVFYPKTLKQLGEFVNPKFLLRMLPLGIFATAQAIAYLYAFKSGGDASQVGTIRQSQVIVTVLLAIIILNEKDNLIRKLVAVILVTVGVFLLR